MKLKVSGPDLSTNPDIDENNLGINDRFNSQRVRVTKNLSDFSKIKYMYYVYYKHNTNRLWVL